MAKGLTQTRLAKHTGLSQQRLSQLRQQAIWNRDDSPEDATRKIIAHLGSVKAAHKSEKGLDLIHERARLSAAQADKTMLELRRMMAELIPLSFLTEILAFQNSNIRTRTLGIPNALKVKHPQLPTPIFLSLKEIVVDVLTALSHVRFPAELDERIKRYFRDCLTAAQSNGDGVGEQTLLSEPGDQRDPGPVR